ncbi:MAG: DUF3857 domain-containing protein, partial [Candidatus Latescibacterota bacterium]
MNGFRQRLIKKSGVITTILAGMFAGQIICGSYSCKAAVASADVDNWQYTAGEINRLKKQYPSADAVILKQSVSIEMDEQGLITYGIMRRVALFTDNGIRRYADPRLMYNAATQGLTVSTARVYMRDGIQVDSGKNAFNPSTPFAFAEAPDYTDWQEMVVTHVGIEKDCVAELNYTICDKERWQPWLSGIECLACEDFSLLSMLTIKVPSGMDLNYTYSNGVQDPQFPSEGVYSWALANVPCRPPMDGGVWQGDHIPAIVFSTAKDWGEVVEHVANIFKEYTVLQPIEVVEPFAANENNIFALHKESIGSVRNIDLPIRLFASNARHAEQIYQSAYAHALDRALILSAKLRARGVDSVPVLVSAGHNWCGEVAALEYFDRILIEVKPADTGDALLLDPDHEYFRDTKSMMPGKTMLRCTGDGEIVQIAQGTPADNQTSLQVRLTMDGEGKLSGEGSVVMTGIFSPYYSVRGLKNETEEFIKSKVERILPSATLRSWNIQTLDRNHVELGFLFESELPAANEHGRTYLDVPTPFSLELSRIDGIHSERSHYPAPI